MAKSSRKLESKGAPRWCHPHGSASWTQGHAEVGGEFPGAAVGGGQTENFQHTQHAQDSPDASLCENPTRASCPSRGQILECLLDIRYLHRFGQLELGPRKPNTTPQSFLEPFAVCGSLAFWLSQHPWAQTAATVISRHEPSAFPPAAMNQKPRPLKRWGALGSHLHMTRERRPEQVKATWPLSA